MRVEIIWNAGRPYEPQRLLAGFTDDLIAEGTPDRSAAEIEAFFEQYGTGLQQPNLMDTANLSLSTIHRHAAQVLPVMAEVIAHTAVTEKSVQRELRRRKQRLRENLSDNDTLAFRFITEAIFGHDNPYGYNSTLEDYNKLTTTLVRQYQQEHYHAGNGTLLVIGQLNAEMERLLEATFGQLPSGPAATAPVLPPLPENNDIFQLRKPRAQQTMIRMGRGGIDIKAPDYPGLMILDTIFGGYFGSRLMRNIREEKGFTYGIESDLETYRFGGSFGLSADVANENLSDVRAEIRAEANKLLQNPVPEAELEMVRAYLLGSIAMELDGHFGHGWRYRSALIKNYEPVGFLRDLNEAVRGISAREIQDLAHRYLNLNDWQEVIVGGAKTVAGARQITRPAGSIR